MARNTLPRKTLRRARTLRREQTGPERDLWAVLKGHELDGSQHGQPDEQAYDRRRDAWFAGRGYRVLRFWNNDVIGNLDGVVTLIRDALHRPGSPSQPSPARGEGFSVSADPAAEDQS